MPSRLAPLALITAIVAGCAPTPTTPSPSVSAALPSPTPTVAPPATSPSANAGCARATSVLANPRGADLRLGSVSSADQTSAMSTLSAPMEPPRSFRHRCGSLFGS